MGFDVSERARRVWDEWNLRGAVLCSLLFQILLIVLANKRRTKGGGVIGAIIWSSYLLADWIAAFAIGLISSGITDDCSRSGKATAVNKQLAAFWAPFLLLHLGGPDAITAFSLEDNELWIRHLMGLAIQVVAVVYVFLQSLALENEYRVPTVLVFFAGACKYLERTLSLYKACLGNFKRSLLPKPDPGPNYAQLMEDYSALEASHVPVTIKVEKEIEKGYAQLMEDYSALKASHIPVTIKVEKEIEKGEGSAGQTSSEPQSFKVTEMGKDDPDLVVREGYRFFETFKGLVVDLMFSFQERRESRRFFFDRTAGDAFRVIEVELNFLYDVLHTKAPIVHCRYGYLCRFLCTVLLIACFHQFAAVPQHNIFLFDKIVTYVLLVGAVALDVVSAFSLMLSDWALVSAGKVACGVLIRLGSWRRERRRWSNSMGQHRFISFCLKEDGRIIRGLYRIAHLFRVEGYLDELWYKKEEACEDGLKEFVFNELKAKAEKAESRKEAKKIYSARGEYVLSQYSMHYSYPSIEASLRSDEAEYDESLLVWHIATQLCSFTKEQPDQNGDHTANGTNQNDGTTGKRIKFCKLLSNYMLYLLVMRPTLMSTVAGIAQIRFQDTCAEADKFFKRRLQSEEKVACEQLLGVKMTDAKPIQVKGDRSKSLLFDACRLANDLKKLDKDRRWEMMSRIWVELLSYAAIRCRPSDHARQLTQGGEFITFVWLLMVHFGLAEEFRIEAGDARAILLVGKGARTG